MTTSAVTCSDHKTNSKREPESIANPNCNSVVNASVTTAVPGASQVKIVQFSSGGKASNSSVSRDQSNSSSSKLQLQSQPQLTKQQKLQIKLQQQNLNFGNNYGKSGSGSGSKLEAQQKGPVLKRINIKNIPSVKRSTVAAVLDNSKSHQAGINLRNVRNQEALH